MKKKQYRNFEEAKKFVHQLGLKRQKDWIQYRKSGQRPDDIPSNPNRDYKNKGWKNFGDWLGTGYIRPADREFKTFLEAREYVHSLQLKDVKDWRKFTKSGNKPEDIPAWPPDPYGKKGWKSWGDWLGTGVIANRKRQYLSFDNARKFVHSLGIKKQTDWYAYCKSNNKPDNIPSYPDRVYKNKGWKGLGDWLGTGKLNLREKRKQYLSFEDAKKFVKKLKFKTRQEWRDYTKSNQRPIFIPASPEKIYKKEWTTMGDWLGTGFISLRKREYRNFLEARDYVRSLNLINIHEWRKFAKSSQKPKDIPYDPIQVYKKEWISLGDWIGTGTVATVVKAKNWLPFAEAREEARELAKKYNIKSWSDWKKAANEGKIPDHIPHNPSTVYGKERKK